MTTTPPPAAQAKPDPVARAVLGAMGAGLLWLTFTTPGMPAKADPPAPAILIATPSPAIAPALELAAPTIAPILGAAPEGAQAPPQAPGAAAAPDPVSPADLEGAPPGEAPGNAPAAGSDYLANVGAQAPHSPRGDTDMAPLAEAPAELAAPTMPPPAEDQADPHGSKVAPERAAHYDAATGEPSHDPEAQAPEAVAVPPISSEQAAELTGRSSNTCAPGEIFYPRTGCHAPGAGGPMPGAVGEP